MSKNTKNREPLVVFDKKWFSEKDLKWSGKRATIVAIYYSLPSNQNGGEGGGTNVIPQKIIPWGSNADPRIYVSPYALKRRIRDYWVKKGKKVGFREDITLIKDPNEIEKENESPIEYIDYDLFGYMSADKGSNKNAKARPGPITTWGAVSLEPYHSFIDFNTSVKHVGDTTEDSSKGGSIFNRLISKEFYFTSFFINPDLIGVDIVDGKQISDKKERLKDFLEGLEAAMQKDTGGPRDRPACVFIGITIDNAKYPSSDKELFKKIKIIEDMVVINSLPKNMKVVKIDPTFVKLEEINEANVDEIIDDLLSESNGSQ